MLMYNEKTHRVRGFPLSAPPCHLQWHKVEMSVCPSEDKHLHVQVSSGPAHGHQTCNLDQFSSLFFFLVFPSVLVA